MDISIPKIEIFIAREAAPPVNDSKLPQTSNYAIHYKHKIKDWRILFTSSGKFHYLVKHILSLTLFGVEVEGKKKFWNEGGVFLRHRKEGRKVLYIASPQQCDLKLLGPPSGQGAGGKTRTRDRRVPADLRADSLTTVSPTPL
ncbi:hypothetical protein PoB_004578200 [Plakobranchus ocellatus]|uniref:Uncharacterized protein n=1 Tax=Plakobranchus ocellatus TaxID=259542 RepID=A0AAV4BK22_9GAST|nr:hypothetical protein PoB_004578200 [Plakobranchus ocellatus]